MGLNKCHLGTNTEGIRLVHVKLSVIEVESEHSAV